MMLKPLSFFIIFVIFQVCKGLETKAPTHSKDWLSQTVADAYVTSLAEWASTTYLTKVTHASEHKLLKIQNIRTQALKDGSNNVEFNLEILAKHLNNNEMVNILEYFR